MPPPPEPEAAPAVSGEVERVDPDGTIEGWCANPVAPAPHPGVAIVVDGHVVARALCGQAGPGEPCRFRLQLSRRVMRAGVEAEIAVRIVGTGQMVGEPRRVRWGGPARAVAPAVPAPAAPPAAALRGNLDRVTRDGWVAGWCWDPARPDARLTVEVLVDEVVVGRAVASDWRPDLPAAGIGDGHHGFSFALPYEVLARTGTLRVAVREMAAQRPLGEAVALRIGLQAEGEQRIAELEREVRLMRGRMEAFVREAEARAPADEHATRALFGTIAAFFQELAEGGVAEARGFGVGPSLRATLDDLRRRLPRLPVPRPARAPDILAVVPAAAPVETVHACLGALLADVAAEAVEWVVIDAGETDPACALLPALMPGLAYRTCGPACVVGAVAELVRETACRWVALIDPRVRVGPGWMAQLCTTLADAPDAAAAGALVVGQDGLVRHGGFVAGPGGVLADPAFAEESGEAASRRLRRVDALAPLAVLIDRAGAEAAGGLRPAFGALAPAVAELCLRLRREGRAVLCQPAARATWTGDGTLDPALFAPDPNAPDDDSRRLRLCLLEAGLGPPEIGRALFVDDGVPRPDRDAGSIAAIEHMRALSRLGWRVTFAPADGAPGEAADRARLERLGIEVEVSPEVASVADLLRREGHAMGLVWITRHANCARLAPVVRAHAPQARLLFAPADLHFLRAEREAALAPLPRRRGMAAAAADARRQARAARRAELDCAREADATLLLSDVERDVLVAEGIEAARLHVLPWVVRPVARGPGFAARNGALFVGGFAHKPNLDAVLWWAEAILPLLRAARPGLVLHVVGADPPPAILALSGPEIRVHGWVEDLSALLARVRLSVAPLRFGAGFKGKVATSLAQGVPVVASGVALEGTGLADGDGVVLAESAEAFAAAVAALHDDAARWEALSARAAERVAALYTPARLDAALRLIP